MYPIRRRFHHLSQLQNKNINRCSNEIESDLNTVEVWSKDTNLVFNPNKTKVMVTSSRQMAQYHQLDSSKKVNIKCNNKNIERVKEYQLLGIILDEHFALHSHVNKILRDGYSTLRTLKLLKRYASYYLRKKIILSKLDYCNILFKTLPQYQKIEWRNFYNHVQVSLNANTDANMTL